MPKHLELEFGSIGEMISMLRYNDSLTIADLQRPVKVTFDIETTGPLDGGYLHFGGPINPEWLSLDNNNQNIVKIPKKETKAKNLARRIIGFRRPDTNGKEETEPEELTTTKSA